MSPSEVNSFAPVMLLSLRGHDATSFNRAQSLSVISIFFFVFLIFFSTFIYFWDRERQSMNRGGAEREGDTESETGSRL